VGCNGLLVKPCPRVAAKLHQGGVGRTWCAIFCWGWPFVWTEFTVPIGKRSELPRGMSLVTRMQELQASMRGIQWHPRVEKFCRKTGTVQHRSLCELAQVKRVSVDRGWGGRGWKRCCAAHGVRLMQHHSVVVVFCDNRGR
jgi:hypothetical protein